MNNLGVLTLQSLCKVQTQESSIYVEDRIILVRERRKISKLLSEHFYLVRPKTYNSSSSNACEYWPDSMKRRTSSLSTISWISISFLDDKNKRMILCLHHVIS